MKRITIPVVTTFLLLIVFMIYASADKPLDSHQSQSEATEPYEIRKSSSTIQVSGIVAAADSAVISAKTNGVIDQVRVKEGYTVASGDVVVVQSTPVEDAETAYRIALGEQVAFEQASVVEVRQYTADKASVIARSAEEIAVIQAGAVESDLQASAGTVRTGADAGLTVMLNALAFANDNPSLFSDSRREQFREIVNDLYGRLPKHFQSSIGYGTDRTTINTRVLLEDMRTLDIENLSITDAETLGVIVLGQLQALVTLYTTAESDVLDSDVVSPDDERYAIYFTNRTQLIEALSALETAQSNLQSNVDTLLETSTASGQSVAVTAIEESLAQRQYDFSKSIQVAADKAAQAATVVAATQASLGTVSAPFPGEVSSVNIDVGEYITAGTPLFTLHGVDAREISVSVPVAVGEHIKNGDPFYINGLVVGSVDRISSVQEGHSIEIAISLEDASLPVGASLSGDISFDTLSDTVEIPRDYVFFDVNGSYLVTDSGEKFEVTVLLDNGETFLVSSGDGITGVSVVPRRTVSF